MNVAYITTYSASDAKQCSGTGYFMAKALEEKGCRLDYIGPLLEKKEIGMWVRKFLAKSRITGKFMNRREESVLRSYAWQVSRELMGSNADIIFSPETFALVHLETNLPIVFWTDATFGGMLDFYPGFSKLCRRTICNGNSAEQSIIDRTTAAIFKSQWAADTAIDIYRADPEKIWVVPNGANITPDLALNEIEKEVDSRSRRRCNLVFMGRDWRRKGGRFAEEITLELNRQGIPSTLHVIGCSPKLRSQEAEKHVHIHGYIDTTDEKGTKKVSDLLLDTHFLLLPSSAECFGIVICEANAHGVPALATNVGGISTAIKSGVNGKIFSKDIDIADWCRFISSMLNDGQAYKNLALSSFAQYENCLNWEACGAAVKEVLNQCLE